MEFDKTIASMTDSINSKTAYLNTLKSNSEYLLSMDERVERSDLIEKTSKELEELQRIQQSIKEKQEEIIKNRQKQQQHPQLGKIKVPQESMQTFLEVLVSAEMTITKLDLILSAMCQQIMPSWNVHVKAIRDAQDAVTKIRRELNDNMNTMVYQ